MNQIQAIHQKAALALNDSFFVELIKRVKASNSSSLVGIIKKFSEILGFENQLAASLRYAAILARDFPDEFKKIEQGEKMKNISYDYSFIKNRWPFPFMLGDWKCLLEIPENKGYKYNPLRNPKAMDTTSVEELTTRLVGFQLKVSFSQPRYLREIKTKLIELAKISSKINVAGVDANPYFIVNSLDKRLESRENSIHNWFLEIKDKGVDASDHRLDFSGLTINDIDLSFDMRWDVDEKDVSKIKEENFRLKYILTCISNWLNIPVDLNF